MLNFVTKLVINSNDIEMKASTIFNAIKGLNPSTNSVSSLGSYVSPMERQLADELRKEVSKALPAGCLAKKIVETASHFTDKQLWVIAFELVKNEEYCKNLEAFYAEVERKDARRKAAKAENRKKSQAFKKTVADREAANANVEVGMTVEVPRFGEGVVKEVSEDAIVVDFSGDVKSLLRKYATINII